MVENVYTVSLGQAYQEKRAERTIKAVEFLRNFLARHSKVTSDKVKISNELNSLVWEHGIKNPPRVVKVVTSKDERGNIIATLFREPKAEEKRQEAKERKKAEKQKKTEAKKAVKKEVKKEESVELKKEHKNEEKKEITAESKKEIKKKEVKERKKPTKGRGK